MDSDAAPGRRCCHLPVPSRLRLTAVAPKGLVLVKGSAPRVTPLPGGPSVGGPWGGYTSCQNTPSGQCVQRGGVSNSGRPSVEPSRGKRPRTALAGGTGKRSQLVRTQSL